MYKVTCSFCSYTNCTAWHAHAFKCVESSSSCNKIQDKCVQPRISPEAHLNPKTLQLGSGVSLNRKSFRNSNGKRSRVSRKNVAKKLFDHMQTLLLWTVQHPQLLWPLCDKPCFLLEVVLSFLLQPPSWVSPLLLPLLSPWPWAEGRFWLLLWLWLTWLELAHQHVPLRIPIRRMPFSFWVGAPCMEQPTDFEALQAQRMPEKFGLGQQIVETQRHACCTHANKAQQVDMFLAPP